MEFNKKLKSLFKERGIKNKEIALEIGYSEMMVSRYLKDAKPNYEFIMALENVYSEIIDWNYLFKNNNSINSVGEENDEYKVDPISVLNRIEVDLKKLKRSFGTNLPQD